MFKATMGKGFQMTFANGNTISVQWGKGNYCENYFADTPMEGVNLWGHFVECKDAEIAIWDKDGTWITKDFIPDLDDDVKGSLSADDVLALMVKVAK